MTPEIKAELRNKEQYAEMSTGSGQEFAGGHFDEIEMELNVNIVHSPRLMSEGGIKRSGRKRLGRPIVLRMSIRRKRKGAFSASA
ncbi:MAG: hypothetical protein ACYCV0_17120 [Desulfitobacteriaceae bacterium]